MAPTPSTASPFGWPVPLDLGGCPTCGRWAQIVLGGRCEHPDCTPAAFLRPPLNSGGVCQACGAGYTPNPRSPGGQCYPCHDNTRKGRAPRDERQGTKPAGRVVVDRTGEHFLPEAPGTTWSPRARDARKGEAVRLRLRALKSSPAEAERLRALAWRVYAWDAQRAKDERREHEAILAALEAA